MSKLEIGKSKRAEGKVMKQIVIAGSGWVFLGEVESDERGGLVITGAQVIRRWGTTKGLGEIALNGPTSETVLDDAGTVRIPASSVVATMDCVK